MAGTAVTQTSVGAAFGVNSGGVGSGNSMNPSDLNSYRVSAVIDRMYSHHIHAARESDALEFVNLCLSLARGLDFSVANNEVPNRHQELPSLIKQVCQKRNDALLQASIMVLMISVKSACQSGWFSDHDSEELNNLAKGVASSFGIVSDLNTVPSSSLPLISKIMSRFYPRMKMGHIFAFLEVKPGFDAYLAEFQITKHLKPSTGEKIKLLVAQTDNIETSSCLVSPAKVNFLLNGKGVERRITLAMDTGPQIPTIITHYLKFGSNLLQAVGEFTGNYIIVIAFMCEVPIPSSSALQDYERQDKTTVDSDSEIIEGPSRISLDCSISRQRIKIPVKGRTCNHIQCFDFNNYVEINSRRPSWRCPSCNQHVCFTDIRIDQKMVKVLQEVGPSIRNVIISADGSWKAAVESDNTVEKPEAEGEKTSAGADESPQSLDVLDLTQMDDAMDATDTYGTEDTKNFGHLTGQNATMNPAIANIHDFNPSNAALVLNGFSSGISTPPSIQPDSQQHPFGNASGIPFVSNQLRRLPAISRNVVRIPNAVQALPAQTTSPGIQQIPINTNIQNNFSSSPAASSMPTALCPPSSTHVPQLSFSSRVSAHMSPAATPNIPTAHNANPRHDLRVNLPLLFEEQRAQQNPSPLPQLQQQNSAFPSSSQPPNGVWVSSEHRSSRPQTANFRTPPTQIQSSMQPPRHFLPRQSHVGTGPPHSQQTHLTAPTRTAPMAGDAMRGLSPISRYPDASNMQLPNQPANVGASSQPANVTNTVDPHDPNWQPAGRMRGALTGQAYIDAYKKIMARSSPQAQSAMPVLNMTSTPSNVPAQLQAMMSAGVTQGAGTALRNPPAGSGLGSDPLADSSGMH